MDTVKKIVEHNTFVHTVGAGDTARSYRLRRFSGLFAMRLHGVKAFGLLTKANDEDAREAVADRMEGAERVEFIQKTLEFGMVSPRLGDVTNSDAGTVALDDLGDDAIDCFNAIMYSGGNVENFTAPPSPAE